MGLTTVAIVAIALAGFGTATYILTRDYLFGRVDQQLRAIQTRSLLDFASAALPPPRVRESGGPLRSSLFLAVVSSGGSITIPPVAATDNPTPPVPVGLAGRARASNHNEYAISTAAGGDTYRLLARLDPTSGNVIVTGLPLDDAIKTLNRLLAVILACAGATLLAAAAAAFLSVRRGLRPLEDIADTADQIAAGDLSHRVQRPGSPDTETGRVATAMNEMLERLEAAFFAQRESENRVRAFAADASHELRTPLTAIRGYAELFRRGAASRPDDLALAMGHIEDEAARMSALVEDLLTLARLDETPRLELTQVDLAAIAHDAVQAAQTAQPTRCINLSADDEAVVIGEPYRLRQVIDNLIANAVRHTPAGTTIDVSVHGSDTTVEISVRDYGPGLPPGNPDRLFDRFTRGDDSRARESGGTGLGLAIVAAITQAHGGTATARDETNGGATFTVEFPSDTSPTAPTPRSG
jgi:two-component system OmpR family sensor kinase